MSRLKKLVRRTPTSVRLDDSSRQALYLLRDVFTGSSDAAIVRMSIRAKAQQITEEKVRRK